MATKKAAASSQATGQSKSTLTLADAYGLGLIAHNLTEATESEIFPHLSPAAQRIVISAARQSNTKKAASKRPVAMKR